MKASRSLFKKGQSYSALPISSPQGPMRRETPDLAQLAQQTASSPSASSSASSSTPSTSTSASSSAATSSSSSTSTSSSSAFTLSLPTRGDKVSLESLISPRPIGSPSSMLTTSSSSPTITRTPPPELFINKPAPLLASSLDGSSKKTKKKKDKKKDKKDKSSSTSTTSSSSASSENDINDGNINIDNKEGKKEKKIKKSGGGSGEVGTYVPPPPSAPPEWARELERPMEQNRFVLDLDPKALKHLPDNSGGSGGSKKKRPTFKKAASSFNMKQHYTMPAVVLASSPASKGATSPRRRIDDIRISAPRNFRNLKVSGLFGVPLDVAMKGCPEWQVPPFLELLCMHIEQQLLGLEGIFRMAGNVDETKLFRDLVNNGEPVDLWKAANGYVVCDLLKIYFREYPDSIVPSSLYSSFIELARKGSPTPPEDIRAIFKEMPQYNKFTLKRVLMCLSKVAAESATNKMDAANLATIFGPSFFRNPAPVAALGDKGAMEKQVADTRFINELTITLIKQYEDIFKDVEYKPYYKCYAKVIRPYKPRTNEDLELVEGQILIITGSAKGILYMGESKDAAGFFPMAHVALLSDTTVASHTEDLGPSEERLRKLPAFAGKNAKTSKKDPDDSPSEESEGESKPSKDEEPANEGTKPSPQAKALAGERAPDSPYLSRARELFKTLDQQEQQLEVPAGKEPKPSVQP